MKPPLRWLGIGLVLALTGGGLVPAGRASQRRPYGGTLQVPVLDPIRTTDPALVTTADELEMARQLHETLLRIGPDGALRPVLAQDLPRVSSNGQELQVELRPEARFHDGSSITAHDVLVSWERLLRRDTGSPHWWLLAPVEGALAFRAGKSTKVSGLEVVNRLSLRIRLAAPTPGFLEVLAAVPTAPVPGSALKPESGGNHPKGSGPFTLLEQGGGGTFTLAAFRDHPLGRPLLDQVIFRPYPSAKGVGLAFDLNEVSLSFLPPSPRSGTAEVVEGPARWMVFLAINPARIAAAPSGLRQAIDRALDRPSLAEYIPWGRATPTDEVLCNEDATPPARLPTEAEASRAYFAKLAIKQVGIPSLTFLIHQGQALERAVAERVQVHLVDVGVAVSVVEAEPALFQERLASGRYDLVLEQSLPLVRDPGLQLLGVVARTTGDRGVEELQRSLRGLSMDESRPALVREKARGVQLGLPWVPLFRLDRRVFVKKELRGYAPQASGIADLAEVWLASGP